MLVSYLPHITTHHITSHHITSHHITNQRGIREQELAQQVTELQAQLEKDQHILQQLQQEKEQLCAALRTEQQQQQQSSQHEEDALKLQVSELATCVTSAPACKRQLITLLMP
jgi:hypothetical protein